MGSTRDPGAAQHEKEVPTIPVRSYRCIKAEGGRYSRSPTPIYYLSFEPYKYDHHCVATCLVCENKIQCRCDSGNKPILRRRHK